MRSELCPEVPVITRLLPIPVLCSFLGYMILTLSGSENDNDVCSDALLMLDKSPINSALITKIKTLVNIRDFVSLRSLYIEFVG